MFIVLAASVVWVPLSLSRLVAILRTTDLASFEHRASNSSRP